MTIRRFPKTLRRKVHRHFKKYFDERTALDECAILNDLNPALRQEVGKFLLQDTVRATRARISTSCLFVLVLCFLRP